MRTVLTFVIFLNFFGCFSQKEAANWFFGNNAGLDFNSGIPLPNLNGQVRTIEGSATISDANGDLLFYTEGTTVWNRNHEVMPNGFGLKGSPSSSQTALIVPNPSNADIYYLFTTDDALLAETGTFNGFNYNVIDMSLDDGLGDVTQKNITLLTVGSEKVSGVLNFNENEYWVITNFQDRFFTYKVDENGVDTNPVISIVGPVVQNFANGRGSLKLSPDGTKLAMTYLIAEPEYAASLFLFDFDINTGVVSNAIEALSHNRAYYGLEFSSDSGKLYASGVNLDSNNELGDIEIVQFDLETPDFFSTGKVVLNYDNNEDYFVAGALQIALDKKIYHSLPGNRLSVLNRPNANTDLVQSEKNRVDLGGREATFGLPPFVQSFFETIFEIENFCQGETTIFTPIDSSNITGVSWNFGDPNSGVLNTSDSLVGEHVFSAAGSYTITINVQYTNGATKQFLEYLDIKEVPNVLMQAELIQCDVDGLDDGITSFNLLEAIPLFDNGNEDLNVLFFTSEEDIMLDANEINPLRYTNTIANETIYAKVYIYPDCYVIVEVRLVTQPLSDLGHYDTLYICNGTLNENSKSVNLNQVKEELSNDFINTDITLFTTKNDALLETDALALEQYTFNTTATTPELFFRIEETNNCAFIGRVSIVVLESPDYEESKTVNLCDGMAVLTAFEGYESYLWRGGNQTQELKVDTTGTYEVTFATGTCVYLQTFEVLPEPEIDIEEIRIEDFNSNNRVNVVLGPNELAENTFYSLDGGLNFQDQNIFSNVPPGIYDLVVDNGCSTYEEQLLVGGVPSFFTPNGDNVNDRWTMLNPTYFPDFEISIFDRYGQMVFSFDDTSQGWDGTVNNMEMPANDYWYYLKTNDGRSVKGFFTLKR